jgi:hypothetical protein
MTLTTLLDALRGRAFDIWVRLGSTSSTSKFTVEAKWGFGPAPYGPGQQTFDTNVLGTGYHLVRLARMFVPDSGTLASLKITLSAGRTSGTGSLDWDFVQFVPVGKSAIVRGELDGPTATTPLGQNRSLLTDPELGEVRVLDANGAVGNVGETKGLVPIWLEPGLHVLTFAVRTDDNDGRRDDIGRDMEVTASYAPRYYG